MGLGKTRSSALATEPNRSPESRQAGTSKAATNTNTDQGPNVDQEQETAARWAREWETGNLLFHSDHDLPNREAIADELSQLRLHLTQELKLPQAEEPIHVIVFAEARDYRGYMKHYFPGAPLRRALYVKRRGPGMVFTHASRDLITDLRHETTHAFLNASLAYVPLWLDEGLAEYFELPAQGRLAESPHLTIARIASMLGQVPSIEALEAIEDLGSMRTTEYRQAWSWVHFLLNESEQSRQILQRFLSDIHSGLPPGPFSRRLAGEMPDYRTRYQAHYRRLF